VELPGNFVFCVMRNFTAIFAMLFFLLTGQGVTAQTELRNGRYHARTDDTRVTGTVVDHQLHGTFVTREKIQRFDERKPRWVTREVRTYVHGNLNGPYYRFADNGDTLLAGAYCNNRYCGEWKVDNGYQRALLHYDSLGNFSGWQIYRLRSNGQIVRRQLHNADGSFYLWTYSVNGYLIMKGLTTPQGKEGAWYMYNEVNAFTDARDTLPVMIAHWKNGKLHGPRVTYERGVVTDEGEYADGDLSGIHRIYRNGILIVEHTMVRGKRNGTEYAYTWGGKLGTVREWENEQLHGKEINYDTATGKVLDVNSYAHGTRVRREQYSAREELLCSEELISADSAHIRWQRYFPSGKVSAYGEIANNQPTGKSESFYENGRKKMSVTYLHGRYTGTVSLWSETGALVYHASVSDSQACNDETVYSDKGMRLQRGTAAYAAQVKKYAPSGLTVFDAELDRFPVVFITAKYRYGRHLPIPARDSVVPESCAGVSRAQFPGGEQARQSFLKATIRYPEMDREMEVQGTVYIGFTVKADSTVTDVVVRDVAGSGLSREVIRAVELMPKWIPAKKNGKTVDRRCVMPVTFMLVQ
jgi:TonB family protein